MSSCSKLTLLTLTGLCLTTVACKKELPYCASERSPTVEMTPQWRSLGLPLPQGARTCVSSDREVIVAGAGKEPQLHVDVRKGLEKQGFTLDEENTAAGTGTYTRVGMRKGLYGLEVQTLWTRDGYMLTLREFDPFAGWEQTVSRTGGVALLDVELSLLLKSSASKDKSFWQDARMLFAKRLPLKDDYARRGAADAAYKKVLAEPQTFLAALDEARARGLTNVRVVTIDKPSDPRLSPLQALAAEAVDGSVKRVELISPEARRKPEAALVLGLFTFSEQERRNVYLPLEPFKDGPIVPGDLVARREGDR